MSVWLKRTLSSPRLEAVTLLAAERRARSYNVEQAKQIRELKRAAADRARAALDLRDESSVSGALAIWREVFALGIRALHIDRNKNAARIHPEELFDELEQFCNLGELPPPPFELSTLKILLGSTDPLELDRLSPTERLRLRDNAETAYRWLFNEVEARSPRQITILRIVQPLLLMLGLTLVVVAAIAAFAGPPAAE
jgi:hypothetical protein